MNVLDLFSGIGGFSLGLERAGMRTVAFCEVDEFCRSVLRRHWPDVPIYLDVRELDGSAFLGAELICGGFPCQPFSSASRGRAVAVDLWPEMLRVIGGARPRWVLGENVPGLGARGVDRVCDDLEGAGYTVRPYDLDVALPERQRKRERFILVAHADGEGESLRAVDAEVARVSEAGRRAWRDQSVPMGVADGIPRRMDRLRALGNAVPPHMIELIGRAIMVADQARAA